VLDIARICIGSLHPSDEQFVLVFELPDEPPTPMRRVMAFTVTALLTKAVGDPTPLRVGFTYVEDRCSGYPLVSEFVMG
jgi:hypothetical protein